MKGNRRHQPKHIQQRKRAARRPARGNWDKGLVRLVICAAIFVLLVAVKLLSPQSIGALAKSAGRLIGRDADFQAAFAAVGRAISGEEDMTDSLQDAYTAVFNPVEPQEEGALSYTAAREVFVSANRLAQYVEKPFPGNAAQDDPIRLKSVDAAAEVEVSQTLSTVSSMPAPPENASLELRSLGFDYITPLRGTVTSPFGWREHPIQGEERFHYGLDIAADTGTAICAFADGTVYATGESSTLGNYIMLEHSGGYITLYAHCDRVTAAGGSVKMGEKIAEVGETGAATGPHLHFELHDGSLYLNPIYYVEVG